MAAGVVFLMTIPFIGVSIVGAGIALMAIGLAKRDEWNQQD
jgi:mannose/fructose/N-acetylgalactosamine-specific phosphotransferase system component IIC